MFKLEKLKLMKNYRRTDTRDYRTKFRNNKEKWFRFRAIKAKSYKNCGRCKFNYEWLCLQRYRKDA